MKHILFFTILLFFSNIVCAQSVIGIANIGYAANSRNVLDFKEGAVIKLGIENRFNKFLSLGINFKGGGSHYIDEEENVIDGIVVSEKELDIFNSFLAINLYPKISILHSDELIISLIPEIGFYEISSKPVIYFTDKTTNIVTHKDYKTTYAQSIGYGLHLQGQYYLTDRLDVNLSIGWNNYDIGLSINDRDDEFKTDWTFKIDEKGGFLYFELGVSYLLFGKDIRE